MCTRGEVLGNLSHGNLKNRLQAYYACRFCMCWLLLAAFSKALKERDELGKKCEKKKNGLEEVQKFGDLKGWESQVFQDPKW